MKQRIFLSGAAALLLLANGCAVNPVTDKKEVVLVSEGQELVMGQQSDPRTDSRKWPS